MRNGNLKKVVYLFLGILIFASCKEEVSMKVAGESVKDITGKWEIVSLLRNGENLTEHMDLSKFRIVFNTDGTYTLEDRFAFMVEGPGTYNLSDPQYPIGLVMKPLAKPEAKARFQFPVVEGERQLSLIMSTGCSSNIYQFNFKRVK